MRFGVLKEGASCPNGRYQLSFQGEIISRKEASDVGTKGLDAWNPLRGVVDQIRPGQFAVLAQDLDFNRAKEQMRNLIGLGIITYIEPMGGALAFSKNLL
jgi:hypothetical protein